MNNSKMHIANILLTFTLFWAFSDSAKPSAKQSSGPDIFCTPSEIKEMDKGGARIVSFTKMQRPYPASMAAFPAWCVETKKDLALQESLLKKCIKGQAKTFGQVLLYSVSTAIKMYCNPKNKKKQADVVVMAKCANGEKVLPLVQKAIQKYINVLHHGAVAKPAKNRIGYMCCYYFRLLTEIEDVLRGHCTEKQATNTINVVRNLVQSLIDVACGDFSGESDTCDKLPPPPEKPLNALLPNATTFVVPLIELFGNLDN